MLDDGVALVVLDILGSWIAQASGRNEIAIFVAFSMVVCASANLCDDDTLQINNAHTNRQQLQLAAMGARQRYAVEEAHSF